MRIPDLRRSAEKGAEVDGTYTRIIDQATIELLDRLQNGDPYVVAGKVHDKPVSARDLALVGAITFDKQQLVRNPPREDLVPRIETYKLASALEGIAEENIARDKKRRADQQSEVKIAPLKSWYRGAENPIAGIWF